METLTDARAHLLTQLDEGTMCPCCGQYARRYRRQLHSGLARWIIALVALWRARQTWIHVVDVFAVVKNSVSGEAVSLLPFWQLIEPMPEAEDFDLDGRRSSGFWRPTPQGLAFVDGVLQLPRLVVVYNNTFEAFEGVPISIRDALGKRFNYAELMRSGPPPVSSGAAALTI